MGGQNVPSDNEKAMNCAVITKAKAMYGKRFTNADYLRLSACRTVEECAVLLKSHPAYEHAFAGADLRGIRRSRIEMLLKREYCLEFDRLIKGLSEKDSELTRKFIGTYELDFIMWALRNAGSDFHEKASYALLYEPLIRKYSNTNFDMLINAQDLRQIGRALRGSYKTTVEKAATGGKSDYLFVENEMWKSYYLELSQHIKKHFKKDDIETLFGCSIDLHNIMRIFRLRVYFDYKADEIIPFIIRPSYRLTDSMISELCSSNGIKEFMSLLKNTPYRRLAAADSGTSLETLSMEFLSDKAGKVLHFSKSAPAVIYAYMIYKNYETDKIKIIIESIRYNLNREMIDSYVGTKAKANQSYRSGREI